MSKNVLSVIFSKREEGIFAEVEYRLRVEYGPSTCLTPPRLITTGSLADIADSIPLVACLDPLVGFAIDVCDLGSSWNAALPVLIDFKGRKPGTMKIKLRQEMDKGAVIVPTPWIDWMDSDYDVQVDEFRRAAAEFVLADKTQPTISEDE
ncbi:MAG TPA: hypothetical protein VFP23_01110 [Solirubrobacterales bacterium]|nr:hypothetical protein [Solirubrobacterales bacterium]